MAINPTAEEMRLRVPPSRGQVPDWTPAPITDLHREALAVLTEVWKLSPEVRLGQLMAHLEFLAEAHLGKGFGTIEDDELIAILYRHRAELRARLQGVPNQTPQPTGAAISVSGSSTLPDAVPAEER